MKFHGNTTKRFSANREEKPGYPNASIPFYLVLEKIIRRPKWFEVRNRKPLQGNEEVWDELKPEKNK